MTAVGPKGVRRHPLSDWNFITRVQASLTNCRQKQWRSQRDSKRRGCVGHDLGTARSSSTASSEAELKQARRDLAHDPAHRMTLRISGYGG